jgi:hypothetical protein
VAAADINGDGKPDLAVVNRNDDTVSVLLNTTPTGASTPSFAPQQTFATGHIPKSVAVGDLNGDGKPDVVVANDSSDTVSVLLNTTPTGSMTVSFAPRQDLATGTEPQSVAVGHLSGAGFPDLAVANLGTYPYTDSSVSVLVGNGDGTFQAARNFAAGSAANSVAVGDFNGDGRQDLVVTNAFTPDGTASVLLNNTQITISRGLATGTISSALEAPAAIAVAAGNNQSATVTTAFAAPLAADVRDAAGNLVQNVSVTFTAPVIGPRGRFGSAASVTVVTNAAGRATAPTLTADTTAGNFQVIAQAAGGSNPPTNFNLTNTPAAASDVTLSGLPANVVAGTPIPVRVTLRDPYDNVATGYTGTIAFTSTDENGGLPTAYTFTAGDAGVHTFAGVVLRTAGVRYVIAYDTTDDTINGVSRGVSVFAAPLDHYTVTTTAANPDVAGTAFDVTVTARDAYGNTATDYRGTVHFTSTDPYPASLPVDYSFTAGDAGSHTFPLGATLFTAGTRFVIAYDSGDSTINGLAEVTVVAAPAAAFQVAAPSSATAGTAFDFTVTAVDPYRNTDTNYTGTAVFSTRDPAGTFNPTGYTLQPGDMGAAVFPMGATLNTAGSAWDVTATDAASSISGTATVNVTPGPDPSPSQRGGRESELHATDEAAVSSLFVSHRRPWRDAWAWASPLDALVWADRRTGYGPAMVGSAWSEFR